MNNTKDGTVTISIDRFKELEKIESIIKSINNGDGWAIYENYGHGNYRVITSLTKDEVVTEMNNKLKKSYDDLSDIRAREYKLDKIKQHWAYKLFIKD